MLGIYPYPAAGSEPIADSQQGQSQGHQEHHQTFDCDSLFPKAGQVLVPDRKQLLLAVRVSHKLQEGKRGTGASPS